MEGVSGVQIGLPIPPPVESAMEGVSGVQIGLPASPPPVESAMEGVSGMQIGLPASPPAVASAMVGVSGMQIGLPETPPAVASAMVGVSGMQIGLPETPPAVASAMVGVSGMQIGLPETPPAVASAMVGVSGMQIGLPIPPKVASAMVGVSGMQIGLPDRRPWGPVSALGYVGVTYTPVMLTCGTSDVAFGLMGYTLVPTNNDPRILAIENDKNRNDAFDTLIENGSNTEEALNSLDGIKGQDTAEYIESITEQVGEDMSSIDEETDSCDPTTTFAPRRPPKKWVQDFVHRTCLSPVGGKKTTRSLEDMLSCQNFAQKKVVRQKMGRFELMLRPFGSVGRAENTRRRTAGCIMALRYVKPMYSMQILGCLEFQNIHFNQDVAKRKNKYGYAGIGLSLGKLDQTGRISYSFLASTGSGHMARQTYSINPAESLARGRTRVYTHNHVFGLARSLDLSDQLTLTPSFSFTYTQLKEKGYSETDAGSFSIAYDSVKKKFMCEKFALKLSFKGEMLSFHVTPFITVIQCPRNTERTASFIIDPSPYTISYAGKTKIFKGLNLKAKIQWTNSFTMNIEGRGEFAKHCHGFGFSMALVKTF